MPFSGARKLLLASSGLALLLGCGGDPAPRNLVMISLDTVRRDHLPTYGYERSTAPIVDAHARAGVVFEDAFSQETNTAPSHASMFTALYPHQHGCVSNRHRLQSEQPTLAEILHAAGFRTGAFVSGLPMKSRISGLNRGFQVFDDRFGGHRRNGSATTRRALAWLERLPDDEPYFLFVHLYDAHGPYEPTHEYASLFESSAPGPRLEKVPRYQRLRDEAGRVHEHLNEYVDRYDAMIRYADDQLARLLEAVDLERSVLVILSDHGETLGERRRALDHGAEVFDEQIRIPLILRAPDLEPARVDGMVETVDLLPTLLTLLGERLPDAFTLEGRDLLPMIRGRTEGRSHVYSAARADPSRHAARGYQLDWGQRLVAVRSDRWKLVRYPGEGTDPVELYDLREDPGETRNVATRLPEVREALTTRLARWNDGAHAGPVELSEEVREGLRALGYLE